LPDSTAWAGGSVDRRRPFRGQRFRPFGHRPRRVDHVVDEDARTAGDLADHLQAFDLVRLVPRPPLVDVGEVGVEIFAEPFGRLHPPGVGRHHHHVVPHVELVPEVVGEHRERGQVVDGEVEEPLDLAGVEVDRYHAVRPRGGEGVGDQLRGDRFPRQSLLVLP